MKIEISKEESINGRWKWRVLDKDGVSWNNSQNGLVWSASPEGIQTIEEIEKALNTISGAIMRG